MYIPSLVKHKLPPKKAIKKNKANNAKTSKIHPKIQNKNDEEKTTKKIIIKNN